MGIGPAGHLAQAALISRVMPGRALRIIMWLGGGI